MAVKNFGVAFLHGVDEGLTGATVTSFNYDDSHELITRTQNEDGISVGICYDGEMRDATISLKLKVGYIEPDIGTALTYQGVDYILESLSHSQEAEGVRTNTYKLKTYQLIDVIP